MCTQDSDCRKPKNLEGRPEDCSPEQVRECHGDREAHPCIDSQDCDHPEKLSGSPEDCSPEQVRECHGSADEHPCT